MPMKDIRVKTTNGYGVTQEYSVDVWQGFSMASQVYVVPNNGGSRFDAPIRQGTKVHQRAVDAAKAKLKNAASRP